MLENEGGAQEGFSVYLRGIFNMVVFKMLHDAFSATYWKIGCMLSHVVFAGLSSRVLTVPECDPEGVYIGGGMAKAIHSSVRKLYAA